jgi:hypothetical protein
MGCLRIISVFSMSDGIAGLSKRWFYKTLEWLLSRLTACYKIRRSGCPGLFVS